MAIQLVHTAHSERLNPEQYWPQYDEEGYIQAANSQMENARKAFQSGEAVAVQATGVVSQTMEGQTADAAMARFASDGAKLEHRGGVHSSNAAINAAMAQNVVNRKAQINFLLANHEADVEAIKAKAVAQGWTQHELQTEVAAADDGYRQQIETVAQNSDQAHEELKGQLNTGEPPSVPSSMPGGVPGEGSPTLDGLDPEVEKTLGGMLGTGGMDPQALMGMAGMAQQALNPLTGALQGQSGGPLDQAIQQGSQAGLQALQQLLGQAGGGAAELTPDQVEELIAGQGGSSTDGLPGGHEPGGDKASGDAPKFENPDRPETTAADTKTDAAKADTDTKADAETETASAAPSPAAEPVSAAPPTSAMHPTTELSGDSGTATASAPTTQLSGAGAGASTLGAGTLGAPGAGGGFAGGAPGMGAGGFTGAPAMGPVMGPMAPASPQGVARGGSAVQGPTADTAQARGGASRLDDILSAPQSSLIAATAHLTSPPREVIDGVGQRVRSVIAYLRASYEAAGLPGPLAVAVLDDRTLVFCTRDGLGYVPEGVRLPAGVLPLCEFPGVGHLFRQDYTGRLPGLTLRAAAAVPLIPSTDAIFCTDQSDFGVPVPRAVEAGAAPITGAVTRDQLGGVAPDDVADAVSDAQVALGVEPPTLAEAAEHLVLVREATDEDKELRFRVLAGYLMADARRGSTYAARQLSMLMADD